MQASIRSLCLVLLILAGRTLPARSQCLPLQVLTQNLVAGHLTPQTMTASIPSSDWEMHQPATGPVFWVFTSPNPGPSALADIETRLELRRSNQQTQYDVVFKTPRKTCFTELRAELRRAKLKVEPVTCLQCEAERFLAATYSVTLYNQLANFNLGKAPYPYVVVVHLLEAPTSPN